MPDLQYDEKLHYKMYKAGKRWLFAGVATFALSTAFFGGQIKADTTSTATSNAVQSTQVKNDDVTKTTKTAATSASSQASNKSVASQASSSSVKTTSQSASQSSEVTSSKSAETSNQKSETTSASSVASQVKSGNSATSAAVSALKSNSSQQTSQVLNQKVNSIASSQDSSETGKQSAAASASKQSFAGSQATSATSQVASQKEQVTSLAANTTDSDVATAKQSATSAYKTTGAPQKITRMDATATSANANKYSEDVSDGSGNKYTLYRQGETSDLLSWFGNGIGYTAAINELPGSYVESTDPSDGVLGVTKHFTIFTFDSLSATDLSGNVRLAVGGDLSLTNSGIRNTGQYSDYPEVIVGGDTVQFHNSTPAGKVYINTNTSAWSDAWAGNAGLKLYQINTSDFFTAAKAYLTTQSNSLTALKETPGTSVVAPSASDPNLNLNGVVGDEDVFVINSSDIPVSNGAININNVKNKDGKTAKVIINVSGDSVSFNSTTISINGQSNDAESAANITWNMPDVVSLITNQAKLSGNLLAPNATFYTNGSMSTDSNIAVKTYGQDQLNQFTVRYVTTSKDGVITSVHPDQQLAVIQSNGTIKVSPVAVTGYKTTKDLPPTLTGNTGNDTLNSDGTVNVAYNSGFWGSNVITFHYIADPVTQENATLTVNYLDNQNKTLQASKTYNGTVNSKYTASDYEPEITGYTLDTGSASPLTGTLKADQTVNLIYTPNAQSLRVKYVNQNGEPITVENETITDKTISGTTGSVYDASADKIKIPGYTFTAVIQGSKTFTGTFPTDQSNQDITLEYSAKPQAAQILYEDENGKSIYTADQLTGTTGSTYDLTGKQLDIPGYTFSSVSGGTHDGKFTTSTPAIVYHYSTDIQRLNVDYVDESGNQIADPTLQSGKTGTGYTVQVSNIPGYTFDSQKTGSVTGTYTVGDQTVKLVYQKIPAGGVTFKFINAHTQAELQTAQTINGTVGDPYQYTAPSITGYTLSDSVKADQTGTFTTDSQIINLLYVPNTESGAVNYYLNNTTTSLKTSDTLTGDNGTSQAITIPKITHYQPVTTSATMQFTMTTQPVNIYYEPVTAAPVTVVAEYKPTDGNAQVLSTQTLASEPYGTSYTTSAPTITGYTWDQTRPQNATGSYSLDPQTVTYYYQKAVGQPVTVNYIDNQTQKLLDTVQLTGQYGDKVTADVKSFNNYALVGQSNQTSVYLTDQPQTIDFLYEDTTPRTINVEYVHWINNNIGYVSIAPSTAQPVNYQAAYSVVPKEITGYYLYSSSASASLDGDWSDLKAGNNQNSVVFFYKADPESFKIHYVDQAGNDLFNLTPAETISGVNGYYGLGYTIKTAQIAGYTLLNNTAVSGVVSLNPEDITFHYAKDETVTTNYVDENGKVLLAPVTTTVSYGNSYKTKPVKIDGYNLKETPANANGEYEDAADKHQNAKPISVTYVYEQVVPSNAPSQGSVTSTPASTPTSQPQSVASQITTSTPTSVPSQASSVATSTPTSQPQRVTSQIKTSTPTSVPSQATSVPTSTPTSQPQSVTSQTKTSTPTSVPSQATSVPTSIPASQPQSVTSQTKTSTPTSVPSQATSVPTSTPTSQPQSVTSQTKTSTPTSVPSQATSVPTSTPTSQPQSVTSQTKTNTPTSVPSQASSVTTSTVTSENSTPASQQPQSVTSQTATSIPTSAPSQASSMTPLSALGHDSQASGAGHVPAMVAAPIGKLPAFPVAGSKIWDPIRLLFKVPGGKTIKVTEVEGFLGKLVDITSLVPKGYRLAPGQSRWLLLNGVTPQTISLIKDSGIGQAVSMHMPNWQAKGVVSQMKLTNSSQFATQPIAQPMVATAAHTGSSSNALTSPNGNQHVYSTTVHKTRLTIQHAANRGTTKQQRTALTARLPQTSDQKQSGLIAFGFAMLSLALAVFGRRKRKTE